MKMSSETKTKHSPFATRYFNWCRSDLFAISNFLISLFIATSWEFNSASNKDFTALIADADAEIGELIFSVALGFFVFNLKQ